MRTRITIDLQMPYAEVSSETIKQKIIEAMREFDLESHIPFIVVEPIRNG